MSNQRLKNIGLTGTLFSGLALGLPLVISGPATAQLNPCPGLYYEEPYNSSYLVPEGCPPNAITQFFMDTGGRPVQSGTPASTPIPQADSIPNRLPTLSTASPESQYLGALPTATGTATIQIENTTNVPITYRVTGQTDWRMLMPATQDTLSGLPLPASIVMSREDNGFIEVVPNTLEQNSVSISLSETDNLTDARRTVEIFENGQIFAF